MIITSQGFGHFVDGINNQDFGIESSRAIVILDGCSGAKYSEVGTKLFAQLLKRKEDWDNVEKFEDNVEETFNNIIQMFRPYYTDEKLENFIMDNLLFTIIALFQDEEKFIVKIFGDGYVVSQNKKRRISYMKFYYGKCPPYYAYRFCRSYSQFLDHDFKTLHFSKKSFSNIGIATDGIVPVVTGLAKIEDEDVIKCDKLLKMQIEELHKSFYDDVTIGAFVNG